MTLPLFDLRWKRERGGRWLAKVAWLDVPIVVERASSRWTIGIPGPRTCDDCATLEDAKALAPLHQPMLVLLRRRQLSETNQQVNQ